MPLRGAPGTPQRVLLLEPNTQVRSVIRALLDGERYLVEQCDSLEQLLVGDDSGVPNLALAAWQSLGGLLAEENRDSLVEFTRRVRLIVMVPRHWARRLETTDLADVIRLLPKPFEVAELFGVLESALATSIDV